MINSYDTWWTIHLTNAKMNGTSFKVSNARYAIIDTGTSLLYLLESDYQYFATMVMEASPDF